MSDKRSIRTVYNGVEFRSKLEADWACLFDSLGVQWEYEKAGHYFGNVFYLPDFWLPRSRQFVEVKGVFEPDDCRKIQALVRHVEQRALTSDECPDIPIVAAIPDGVFWGWVRSPRPVDDWWQFLTKSARPIELLGCSVCGGWWFADTDWSWRCQCCGASAGNAHIAAAVSSPVRDWNDPLPPSAFSSLAHPD
jgi:hypothetical protein